MTTSSGVPLPELPRAWPAAELPGYRQHPARLTTYSGFPYDELPPIERKLDDTLDWLCSEAPVPSSLAGEDTPARRKASSENLSELLRNHAVELPPSFVKLIVSG